MASPATAAAEIQVVSVGDLILEISDSSETTRFTVASVVLSIASPVLRAMIGPNSRFHERQAFLQHSRASNGGNLFVLELPDEESVEAFGILLHAIHLQYHMVPKEVDFDMLVKLAVICDKYDMATSVITLVDGWAARSEAAAIELWYERRFSLWFPTRGEYADWIFVAWVFGREETFYKLSTGLKLKTRGDGPEHWKLCMIEDSLVEDEEWHLHIPDTVIEAICRGKDEAIIQALRTCHRHYSRLTTSPSPQCLKDFDPTGSGPTCKYIACDTLMLGAMTRLFDVTGLDPDTYELYLRRHSLNGLCWDVKCFDVPEYLRSDSSYCTRGDDGSKTPQFGPDAYCKYHGDRWNCYGPSAHAECDFRHRLCHELWQDYNRVEGLKLSEFPSRRGKFDRLFMG